MTTQEREREREFTPSTIIAPWEFGPNTEVIIQTERSTYKIRRVKPEEADHIRAIREVQISGRHGALPPISKDYPADHFLCIKLGEYGKELDDQWGLLGLSPEISGIQTKQPFRIGPGGTSQVKIIEVFEAVADTITPQVQRFIQNFPPQVSKFQTETTAQIGRALGQLTSTTPTTIAKEAIPQELARVLKAIAEDTDTTKITKFLQNQSNPEETVRTLDTYLQALPLIKPFYQNIEKHEKTITIEGTTYLLTIKVATGLFDMTNQKCPISISLQTLEETQREKLAAEQAVKTAQKEVKEAEKKLAEAKEKLQAAETALQGLSS